ncbi:hypothetical protein MPSEU_000592400 [Mayamaea pseudoterrestris]|nr:hypothetical protein MPSEU_000592400 [Mayamaea pseudoterrestris]
MSPAVTAPPASGNAQQKYMRGYAALAQLGQRKYTFRILLPFLLLIAYVFTESLLRVNMVMTQQDLESRRTFGGEMLSLTEMITPYKVPMHTCRAGDQILQMPEKVPGFLIVGAQKGGTTALFTLLNSQKDAMGSEVPETHFFNHYIHQTPPGKKSLSRITDDDVCLLRNHYVKKYFHIQQYLNMTRSGKHIVVFEKTPAYLRTPGVAAKIHRILGPDLKLLVVLRDPIDRAFSYYSMIQEHDDRQFCFGQSKANLTFDQLVTREIEQLQQLGISRAPPMKTYSVRRKLDHLFVPRNMTQRLQYRMENKIRQSARIGSTRLCGLYWNSLYMGMYAMQLKEWIQYYPLGTHLKVIRSEALKEDMKRVYGEVLDFIGLSAAEIDEQALNQDLSPQSMGLFNSTKQEISPATERTIKYLRKFYKPYNDELATMLGEDWRNVWDR